MDKPKPESIIYLAEKITEFFKPYSPEMKGCIINAKENTARFDYKIDFDPNSIKARFQKIEIPIVNGLEILDIMDPQFNNYVNKLCIDADKQKYIIKASELNNPPYFIRTKGRVERSDIEKLVRIQPACNRNDTDEYQRYWISAMIRNVNFCEEIYKSLEIDHLSLFVNISIERYFTTDLTKELKKPMEILQKFLEAGRGRDKQKLFKAWGTFRKNSETDEIDIKKIFTDLMNKIDVLNYIDVDEKFWKGNVDYDKQYDIFPKSINCEALTRLTLDRPEANGYLTFQKHNFKDSVESNLKSLKAIK